MSYTTSEGLMAYETAVNDPATPIAEQGDPPASAADWLAEIDAAERDTKTFRENGHKIVSIYLDKREGSAATADASAWDTQRVNLFTTNTNIMLAILYGRVPKPFVDREFQDMDDDVARVAGTILERLLTVQARSDFDCALRQVIFDRLTPGIGQLWFRYCPDIQKCKVPEVAAEDGTVLVKAFEYDRVVSETIATDYVYWDDFFWSPARTWSEVMWVARRIWMTKEQATKRWGREWAEKLQYTKSMVPPGASATGSQQDVGPRYDKKQYAQVFEIWCKTMRKVHWVSKGCDWMLEEKSDPLGLSDFFPCPPPLVGVHSNSNVQPRADYSLVQDQYEQLDLVNARVYALVDAVRVVGVYDKTATGIQRMLQQGTLNQLIPVDNWAMFAEKGGIKGMIDWLPIDAVVSAIDKLRQYRADVVAQIYELTGMSDIIRGATKASETATAQELKSQYASIRIQHVQMGIASFTEHAMQIKYEIAAKRFDPQTWATQTNMAHTPDGQFVQPAIELLRDPKKADFRINVTADSLAVPDYNAERDARVVFLRTFGSFVEQIVPMVQQVPESAPFLLKMVQWTAAGFRVSRNVESLIDQAVMQIEKALAAPKPPPPPDPKIETEKMKQQTMQMKAGIDQQVGQQKIKQSAVEHQQDLQFKQHEHTMDVQFKQQEGQLKVQQTQQEGQVEVMKAITGMQVDAQKHGQEMRQDEMGHRQKMQQDSATAKAKAAAMRARPKAKDSK